MRLTLRLMARPADVRACLIHSPRPDAIPVA
jgi:hypothetical protein